MKRITSFVAAMIVTACAAIAVAGTEGTATCTDVAGKLTLKAFNLSDRRVEAIMTGDIQALRTIQILDVDYLLTPIGVVTAIHGRGVILTENGLMRTRDHIFLKKVAAGEPQRHWRGVHRIVNGTGEFASASGLLRSNGIIGPGARTLDYEGQVCVPTATP